MAGFCIGAFEGAFVSADDAGEDDADEGDALGRAGAGNGAMGTDLVTVPVVSDGTLATGGAGTGGAGVVVRSAGLTGARIGAGSANPACAKLNQTPASSGRPMRDAYRWVMPARLCPVVCPDGAKLSAPSAASSEKRPSSQPLSDNRYQTSQGMARAFPLRAVSNIPGSCGLPQRGRAPLSLARKAGTGPENSVCVFLNCLLPLTLARPLPRERARNLKVRRCRSLPPQKPLPGRFRKSSCG